MVRLTFRVRATPPRSDPRDTVEVPLADGTERPPTRPWADVLALVTGVALIGLSLWPSILVTSPEGVGGSGRPGTLVIFRVVAGITAVVAVFAAQAWRRRTLARALLVAAAVVLVVALTSFRDFGAWALGTVVLPAALLLVSATAVGPLPEPD